MSYIDYIENIKEDYNLYYNCVNDINEINTKMLSLKANLLILKDMSNFITYSTLEERQYFLSIYQKINQYLGV